MIKINLLPKTIRQKKELNSDLYIFIAVVIVALGLVGGFYVKNTRDISSILTTTEFLKKEVASLAPLDKEFAAIEKDRKDVSNKLAVITKISEGRAIAPKMLYDLSSIIRDTMWLKTLRKDGNKLYIEGRSVDNESISDFVERLSKLPYLKDLELRSVEDTSEGGITVKKFTIDGSVSA
jgi:type IV pilus assembly protein PilN